MHSSTDLLLSLSSSLSLHLPPAAPPARLPAQYFPPPRRMTHSMRTTPPRLSFDHLSTELLGLVLQQLRDIDLHSLQTLRLVDRRFNLVALPIVYRQLTLNENLVAFNAKLRHSVALKHISIYTNHVIVPNYLDRDGINRVLFSIQRLASIRWMFLGEEFDSPRTWVPSSLINLDPERFSNIDLYVDNLPLQEFSGHPQNPYTQAVPGRLLKSLTLASPSPALTARLGSVKQLLLQSPGVETFDYNDRGQGTSFKFEGVERLPSFSSLRMRSYNWTHTSEEVLRHWDFSRIESLELISVPLFNFLSSVFFDDFSNLHRLHVEDYSAHLPDKREEATGWLYVLIRNHIRALEVLDITCHIEMFPLDALLCHGHSLQVLSFRDHVGFCEDDRRCPTLWASDVALLSQQLKHVHTLEMDMDVDVCHQFEFLHAVSKFPSLHSLTLHIQTLIHPLEVVPNGIDRDSDAAMQILGFLVHMKQQTTPQLSWKQITINVGGWKPIMVRRLGSGWRKHNEHGLYAERCFVLDRDARGQLVMKEEVGFETPTRRSSPGQCRRSLT